ncbi:MAG: hypothetical protein ABR598_02715 [Candidatus Dormibacteria bacterium]
MGDFQSIFLTLLGLILAAWVLAGLIAGLAYTMGGPRLTSARQSWRY